MMKIGKEMTGSALVYANQVYGVSKTEWKSVAK
jgi:hypothetical protein